MSDLSSSADQPLADGVKGLRHVVARLLAVVDHLTANCERFTQENEDLRRQVAQLKSDDIEKLKRENAELRATVKAQKAELDRLQALRKTPREKVDPDQIQLVLADADARLLADVEPSDAPDAVPVEPRLKPEASGDQPAPGGGGEQANARMSFARSPESPLASSDRDRYFGTPMWYGRCAPH